MKEVWKDIPDYDGRYQVSNIGRVRSLDKEVINSGRRLFCKGRVLSSSKHNMGYLRVSLPFIIRQKKRKSFFIHRLVLMAFKGMPTKKRYDCNHINGIKADNRIENLEWCSRKENIRHSFRIGLSKQGEDHHRSKLKEKDVVEIKELLRNKKLKQIEIARKFNVSDVAISMIKSKRNWSHIS